MTYDLIIRTGRDEAGRLQLTDVQPIRSHPRRSSELFSWDRVSDQELARLARDHSAQQIATMLGCSRNAVIGRCRRRAINLWKAAATTADLKQRTAVDREAARFRKARRSPAPRLVSADENPAPIIAAAEPSAAYEPSRIPLMNLRPAHCRWPLWRTDAPFSEKFFCGNEVVPSQSYCRHCLGLSINPQHTRDIDRRLNLKKLARAA